MDRGDLGGGAGEEGFIGDVDVVAGDALEITSRPNSGDLTTDEQMPVSAIPVCRWQLS